MRNASVPLPEKAAENPTIVRQTASYPESRSHPPYNWLLPSRFLYGVNPLSDFLDKPKPGTLVADRIPSFST
jgi:hypothetical protein